MTKKEQLQEEYKLKFGKDADEAMTIKDLEKEIGESQGKKKSNLVNISNGRVTKNITNQQWKNMQAFKHDWKQTVTEPKEVQKLKDNGKDQE